MAEINRQPAADVVERTLFDERMAEYQEALDKANEKLAYITGTDDYHYDLEYGREQLNSYVSALVYDKTQERKKGKNIATEYDEVDQFVCSECGIELQGWVRVERDEDDGDETHHEYRFNFCPNCGADCRGNRHEQP